MQAIITPGTIQGIINPPPSKSMMQRVCVGALLHKGKTIINNPGVSNDDKISLDIIQQLGATVSHNATGAIIINSHGIKPASDTIFCGESGLSTRLFTPVAALSNQQLTITGEGSLLTRPMQVFEKTLPQLGVMVKTNNGCVPITVKGPLQTKDIIVDGSLSSQFLSGLLFAYAFTATKPVTIKAQNLVSKPYIDLTLHVLRKFGINLMHERHQNFYFEAYHGHTSDRDIYIEADWSAAANWLIAAAIGGNLTLNGMHIASVQADAIIMRALEHAGVRFKTEGHSVKVDKADELNAFNFNAVHCPDLIPSLAVLAGLCNGTSSIKGMHRLVHKESNRVESVSALLYHLGVSFRIEDDTLYIDGIDHFEAAEIDSYNDHRIVMAASIAALRAEGAIVVKNAGAVAKSYPDFFQDLSSVGAQCILKDE